MEKGMEKFKGQSEPPALISSCSSQNISGHVPCQMLEWILSHKQLKMDFAINAFLINAFQSLLKESKFISFSEYPYLGDSINTALHLIPVKEWQCLLE